MSTWTGRRKQWKPILVRLQQIKADNVPPRLHKQWPTTKSCGNETQCCLDNAIVCV